MHTSFGNLADLTAGFFPQEERRYAFLKFDLSNPNVLEGQKIAIAELQLSLSDYDWNRGSFNVYSNLTSTQGGWTESTLNYENQPAPVDAATPQANLFPFDVFSGNLQSPSQDMLHIHLDIYHAVTKKILEQWVGVDMDNDPQGQNLGLMIDCGEGKMTMGSKEASQSARVPQLVIAFENGKVKYPKLTTFVLNILIYS
jgi:hypothetical protein